MNILNKRNQPIIGISVLLVILVAFFLVRAGDAQIIKYKDPKLTDSEKQVFIDRIAGLEEELKSLENDEQVYAYKLNIASNYGALGEYDKARKILLSLTRSAPDRFVAWADLSVIETFMQDYKNAERHIREALSLNPGSSQYWIQLLDLSKGPLDKSRDELTEIFTEAMTTTADNVDIIIAYARYVESQGDLVKAVELWRKAIKVNPGSKELYEDEIERLKDMI